MAQVELQCGPFRVVSLMSSEAVARARAGARVGRRRRRQVDHGHRRNPEGRVMRQSCTRCVAAGCCWAWPCSAGVAPTRRTAPSAGTTTKTLTVYAAASLTSTVHRAGQAVRGRPRRRQGRVQLRRLLRPGRADPARAPRPTCSPRPTPPTWTRLTGDDLQGGDPADFATNTLEIAVPPDNPAGIASFADLAKPGVKVVVCAPEVPCGAATEKVEEAAGRRRSSPSARSSRSPTCSPRSPPARPTPGWSTSPT